MSAWLKLDPADAVAMARLRDFLITEWSESITEQTARDNDVSEAELANVLRWLRLKVLGMTPEELMRIVQAGRVSDTTH